jgi:16S rRNA (guanine527-N7)-methyltransferase
VQESDQVEFRTRLKQAWPELSAEQEERVSRFYRLVLQENEIQNLTRQTSPKDFIEGHVLDVKALLKSALVSFPAMDLGSGCGVPGLLTSAVAEDRWVLADSEGRKAAFLAATVETLGLKNVQVFSGRGEEFLKTAEVGSIVARAVGPVERIYAWLRNCSTWNNLVLFKGPGWDAEWQSFLESKYRAELDVDAEYGYTVGNPVKNLRIVRLIRTKRAQK